MGGAADGLDFLAGGGEAGAVARLFDWRASPPGDPAGWPQSLRTAVAIVLRSPVAMALLWGPTGILIYNDGYAAVAGGRHPAIFGLGVLDAWPEVADWNARVLAVGLAGGTLSYRDQELALLRDGRTEPAWFDLDYGPVLDESGRPAGVLAVVVETTARVLAARRVAAEHERLRRMFAQAPGFMAVLAGPEHRFEIVNESYRQLVGHRDDLIGKTVREALPEIEGQGYLELLDRVFATGSPFTGRDLAVDLQRAPGAPVEKRFVDLVYQPLTDADDRPTGIFVEGTDVTDRALAAERRQLLLQEMNHRVKNLFAIVQAMIRATARSADTPAAMAGKLADRLAALAAANDLIGPGLEAESAAPETDFAALLAAVMRPHAGDPARLSAGGPAVTVGRAAVTPVALFLHEIATNAAKYGALSRSDGRVGATWSIDGGALRFTWTETGGPAVTAPAGAGFGSTLVRRSVEGQLGGRLAYDWRPDGLVLDALIGLAALGA